MPASPARLRRLAAIEPAIREHMGRYTHPALDAHSEPRVTATRRSPRRGIDIRRGRVGRPQRCDRLVAPASCTSSPSSRSSSSTAGRAPCRIGALVFGGGGIRRPNQASAAILVAYTVAVIVAAVVSFRFLTRVDRRRRGMMPMLGAVAVVAVLYVGLCGLCFGGLAAVSSL